jgi:hypothetical protein
MSPRFLAGKSVFNELPSGWSELPDQPNPYALEGDHWDDDDPEPRYWDEKAIFLCIGIIAGIVLGWIPAGMIIWRMANGP